MREADNLFTQHGIMVKIISVATSSSEGATTLSYIIVHCQFGHLAEFHLTNYSKVMVLTAKYVNLNTKLIEAMDACFSITVESGYN